MNSFLVRRLVPFYIFAIISEFILKLGLAFYYHQEIDFSFSSIIQTIGVLSLTTSVAFIFMALPYVGYLLLLPQSKVGSKTDKILTTLFFSGFVFFTYIEIIASALFWHKFSSAFNFIAVDSLIYTNQIGFNLLRDYPVVWTIIGLGTATIITVYFCHKYIVPQCHSPKIILRLFHSLIYCFICLLAFRNVNPANMQISNNRFNNELAKQGTFSLCDAFWKNEINYDDFYLTREEATNIALLQGKFKSNNITYIDPKKSIARQINAFRPEKRANIIIVLMESMSAPFISTEKTPFLNQLAQESLYFNQVYATGTQAIRGIEALTLSMPPLPGMPITRRSDNENLYGMGQIFKEKGYDNKWIYGGYGLLANTNYFMEKNGFQVLDKTNWSKDDVSFSNIWGACDEDLFNKIITEADLSYKAEKPFLTLAMTLSNHHPYTYPEGKIDLPSKIAGRNGGIKYADFAIKKFIEQAKEKPWFNNTLFVFIANRGADSSGNEEINISEHLIPALFYGPQFVSPHLIDKPISQIDILPTVLGLLDISYESHFFGQDALSAEYEPRAFVSNYQQIGYLKQNGSVILKPIRQYIVQPDNLTNTEQKTLLEEAVAFYQTANDWQNNMKIDKDK
ncbi:MAG: sulfatase-like hydrolase/transferase [Alphaproteobacteria bacterium]|nr:sulfatase-like hydrolase/transferase [Alphaproteobacteria bacterium]